MKLIALKLMTNHKFHKISWKQLCFTEDCQIHGTCHSCEIM